MCYPYNSKNAKHVESALVPCLDEGSNPSGSTPKAESLLPYSGWGLTFLMPGVERILKISEGILKCDESSVNRFSIKTTLIFTLLN